MADDKEDPVRVATPIYNRDDEALVLMAGLPAQGTMASTEMQRRLKRSVEMLDQNLCGLQSVVKAGQEAADRLNRGIFWLTVVILIATLVQVGLGVYGIFFKVVPAP